MYLQYSLRQQNSDVIKFVFYIYFPQCKTLKAIVGNLRSKYQYKWKELESA